MSGPRMGASQMNGNSRRPPNITRIPPNEKQLYAQHDDLIKYVYDSWSKVTQEASSRNNGGGGSAPVYLQEPPNQKLKDFEPFDLEAYWARQVMRNLQQQQQQQQHS